MKDAYMKELVRKAYLRDGKSLRQISRELGIHRDTIKKLLDSPAQEKPAYSRRKVVHRPVMAQYLEIIETWLKEDEEAPKKQRHTAHRIYERLKEEYGFQGCERTVRKYVAKVRKKPQEGYLPLGFQPGEMAQVDWTEVWIFLKGIRTKVYLFSMTMNYSGAYYFEAFDRQNQESFFQGHVNAFHFFGGVAHTLTYDNLKSAVDKIFRGTERKENERFVAFRSAWLFDSRFCNPAKGNEKGRVENMVKHAQRNLVTPLPRVNSFEELDELLHERCLAYQQKTQARQTQTVGERLQAEKGYLLSLPEYHSECCRIVPVKADKTSLVQFETNRYSVPSEYAYRRDLWLKAFVNRVEITDQEKTIATHTRLKGRFEESIRFEHYRKVLERKPGGWGHLRAPDKEPLPLKTRQAGEHPYPKTTVQAPNLTIYRQLLRRHAHDSSSSPPGDLSQETALAQCGDALP